MNDEQKQRAIETINRLTPAQRADLEQYADHLEFHADSGHFYTAGCRFCRAAHRIATAGRPFRRATGRANVRYAELLTVDAVGAAVWSAIAYAAFNLAKEAGEISESGT